jgi:hypothetical protein
MREPDNLYPLVAKSPTQTLTLLVVTAILMEGPNSCTQNYPATKIDLTMDCLLVTATWINSNNSRELY